MGGGGAEERRVTGGGINVCLIIGSGRNVDKYDKGGKEGEGGRGRNVVGCNCMSLSHWGIYESA